MVARAAFFDPAGDRYGIPTFPWRCAPDGYATRRHCGRAVCGRVVSRWRRR